MKIHTIMVYVCNLGLIIAIVEPIVLLIITLIKKGSFKILKIILMLAVLLFISSCIPIIMIETQGHTYSIGPIEIYFFIATIVLSLVMIVKPLYEIIKQNSLKGEN